jgi:Cu(I)/Ag(I) efflux system membrane fusion protein
MDPYLAGKWICPMHPEVVKDGPGECDVCGMPLVPAESLGYGTVDPENQQPPLVIPKSAALITGKRAVVYVEVPNAAEPTYEGREIVLGPQAGDYYLVSHGLKEGELVVTNGAFKIDSEIQIQARPSMMTPEGGGGGGHDHGAPAEAKPALEEPSQSDPENSLPAAFHRQLDELHSAFRGVVAAVETDSLPQIRAAFSAFGDAVDSVDSKRLDGHPAMIWKESAMLLGNDAWEGKVVKSLDDARRLLGLLKQHIQRMDTELGHAPAQHAHD